jgi:hypothetical protein
LAADWLTEQGINTEEHLERAIGVRLTFGEQAEEWLHHLRTRNREPIPETSVPSIRSALNRWLLPHLGEMPLAEVGNKALRGLVGKMKGHLSAKTMDTYVNMAKEIVESLLDEDGEPIYARKWSNDTKILTSATNTPSSCWRTSSVVRKSRRELDWASRFPNRLLYPMYPKRRNW